VTVTGAARPGGWPLAAAFAWGLVAAVAAQDGAPSVRTLADGVFTEAQADRGSKLYLVNCAVCHSENHSGGRFFHDEPVPALRQDALFEGWPDLKMYFEWVREAMPADAPMALADQEYVDILAYLLSVNDYPPGSRELPVDAAQLQRIALRPTPP
jgi:cytochrome c